MKLTQFSTFLSLVTAYLIYYEKPQNALDVALEDVVVPSSKTVYKRQNPSGANPQIVVKNEGNATIQRLTIQYGTVGFEKKTYDWTGQLPSFQSTIIQLPNTIIQSAYFQRGQKTKRRSIISPTNPRM